MDQEPVFQVGDSVKVVDKPYRDCPFGWASGMDYYCGREAVIKSVVFSSRRKTYSYTIDLTISYVWCANCFEKLPPAEDFKADINCLFDDADA